jgi:hypothetical protein
MNRPIPTAVQRTNLPLMVPWVAPGVLSRLSEPILSRYRTAVLQYNMLVHHPVSQRRFTSLSADRSTGFHEVAVAPSFPNFAPPCNRDSSSIARDVDRLLCSEHSRKQALRLRLAALLQVPRSEGSASCSALHNNTVYEGRSNYCFQVHREDTRTHVRHVDHPETGIWRYREWGAR